MGTPQGTPQGVSSPLLPPLMTPQGVDDEEEIITPPKPPSSRSSILFALGQLSSEVRSTQDALKELPDRISQQFAPQLAAHSALIANHGTRLDTIERRMYLLWGGGVVVLAIGGAALKFYPLLAR